MKMSKFDFAVYLLFAELVPLPVILSSILNVNCILGFIYVYTIYARIH